MKRHGVTLIEVLVAMAIFVIVGSGAMYVLSAQNRTWKLSADQATMNLTAKATLDELLRSIRMAGSGLPDYSGGLKVYGSGEERVSIAMNDGGGKDTILGWNWNLTTKRLSIAVHDASRFAYLGYARIDLQTPSPGFHAGSGLANRSFSLGVVERADAYHSCGDSVILDVSSLQDPPNNWNQEGDLVPLPNGLVQNFDSITYRKSNDTLYLTRNIQAETIFALGVDSMRLWYNHPTSGWGDSLSSSFPAGFVNKVRLRLVLRTLHKDSKLLATNPSTRGFQFTRMETDLALRNTNLINK